MKKGTIIVCSLLTIAFVACKKSDTPATTYLEASKTSSIKKVEPIVFTLSQVPAGSTVNWTVNPSANTQINTNGNQASIKFAQKGDYTVTASGGSVTASTSVSVLDSTYTGGGTPSTPTPSTTISPFSDGDAIRIIASKVDSGGYSGLIFSALTTNRYTCLTNSLVSVVTNSGTGYAIQYKGVFAPAGCTDGTAYAGSVNYLYPVLNGTNTLKIIFNGTTYYGTIVKTANSYTINWDYTSGVTISPNNL